MDKRKKEYKQMMKKYKKEFKKLLKEAGPWEWGHMTDFMITFMKWMRDYYQLGYNVWAIEDCDAFPETDGNKPTRLQSLNTAIQLYNRWQNVHDDYYKIAYTEEELKHYLRLGFHSVKKENGIAKQLGTKTWYLTLYEDNSKNVEECNKAYKECKHAFFDYLEEHIEEWWD